MLISRFSLNFLKIIMAFLCIRLILSDLLLWNKVFNRKGIEVCSNLSINTKASHYTEGVGRDQSLFGYLISKSRLNVFFNFDHFICS
jgi:hypothetical protein